MKKKLIRGVSIILIALSILFLASSCSEWYNTTYIVLAYGTEWEKWYRLEDKNDGLGVNIKVSPINYDGKGIPNVKISISGKTLRFLDGTPAYGNRSIYNIEDKGTLKNGSTLYKGSYDEYGDGSVVFEYSFYATSNPNGKNSSKTGTKALKIDYNRDGKYKGSFYAYDVSIDDIDIN